MESNYAERLWQKGRWISARRAKSRSPDCRFIRDLSGVDRAPKMPSDRAPVLALLHNELFGPEERGISVVTGLKNSTIRIWDNLNARRKSTFCAQRGRVLNIAEGYESTVLAIDGETRIAQSVDSTLFALEGISNFKAPAIIEHISYAGDKIFAAFHGKVVAVDAITLQECASYSSLESIVDMQTRDNNGVLAVSGGIVSFDLRSPVPASKIDFPKAHHAIKIRPGRNAWATLDFEWSALFWDVRNCRAIPPKREYRGLRHSQQWTGDFEFTSLDENRIMHTMDPWYGTCRSVGDRAFSTSDLAWHPEHGAFLSYENGRLCVYSKINGELMQSSALDAGEGIGLAIVAPFDGKTFVVQENMISAIDLEFSRAPKDEKKCNRRQRHHGFQIR